MPLQISRRILGLPPYAFAAIDQVCADLRGRGIDLIDFGVGDHTLPTPEIARDRLKTAVDEHATTGYPSYVGAQEFRDAACGWMKKRFGISIDPATEICSNIGGKEAVFHMPLAFLNPGDTVLVPTPGYPPYARGTLFAGGQSYFVPLKHDNGFMIDLKAIPESVAKAAKMMWICYPNSPTGAQADKAFLESCVKFCAERDLLLCSDEAYSELYYDEQRRPPTILEVTKKGVLAVFTMSKRSMMTGWRVGWVAGDKDAIAAFKKLKTNIDSGTPNFVQAGAIAALSDERHVLEMRTVTKQKRDILADALVSCGLEDCRPAASLYLWQRVPKGMSGEEFAKALLRDDVAVVCTPGEWISETCADGSNPGAGYVRFALVPPLDHVKKAAERLKKLSFKA